MNTIELKYDTPTVKLELSLEDANTMYSAISFYRDNKEESTHTEESAGRIFELFYGCQRFHDERNKPENGGIL